LGAREFTLPHIPVKLSYEKRQTIDDETEQGAFITGLKRQSMEREVKMDVRDRGPLEKTGETFGTFQALSTTKSTFHQALDITAPMSAHCQGDLGSPSVLKSSNGSLHFKGQRN